tara:strand:+ start:74 stop:364 length:291 start_codon:yes stop_codon:yes gene_type:complete
MANEINISLETGLTLTAKVYSLTGVQQGSDTAMAESSTGQYSANFSVSGLADGEYMVMIFNVLENRGFGGLYVRSGTEITQQNFATLPDIITGANS